ncbi:DEAD/DEAH box helicase [Aliivibrio fischeri]|uniref:DEAD/DEAH box helicase n=1 Tax=Aliivibrio fischeri TaxID=668 RepID=UPI0012D9C93D|nr:DEAD/DEAH box helicase family protein [Aliivibrio fischeri]
MISLRKWQGECVDLVLKHYQQSQKHFLCLATPGAGKSIMAAEVAAQLLIQDKIDFIFCFSPSTAISQGLAQTFKTRLNRAFDGSIGALGASYTYQSLQFFDNSFWSLLTSHRVFVVFDEIHHCAGLNIADANAWGEEIIKHIQSQAKYTLSLTGTPWRSDNLPISLSTYNHTNSKIKCHYTYGLKQAVKDKVCRTPNIVLIDNGKIISKSSESEVHHFSSIREYLDGPFGAYQNIITDKACMRYLLNSGINKLETIQAKKVNAAGLVVASSIDHAIQLHSIISNEFKKEAVIVTHKHDNSSDIINNFRNSTTDWIISVGMISEGTDIPRLQVCCHLSKVKTELYFRQVLGRVLRVNEGINQEAWLYTFAEPNLIKYAYRVAEEIPEKEVILKNSMPYHNQVIATQENKLFFNKLQPLESLDMGAWGTSKAMKKSSKTTRSAHQCITFDEHYFDIVGDFRQQVIDVLRFQG